MMWVECWFRRSRRVLLDFCGRGAQSAALTGVDTRQKDRATSVLGVAALRVSMRATIQLRNRVTSLPCTTCSPQCLQERSTTAPRNCCVLFAHCTFCTETPNVIRLLATTTTVK